MPTTSTTNLTINTLLDIVGQATAIQPHGGDRGAFDALLQAPVATPRPHEAAARPEYDDQPAAAEDPISHVHDASGPPTASADDHVSTGDLIEGEGREDETDDLDSATDEVIVDAAAEVELAASLSIATAAASTASPNALVESNEQSEDVAATGPGALAGEEAEGGGRRGARNGSPDSAATASSAENFSQVVRQVHQSSEESDESNQRTVRGEAADSLAHGQDQTPAQAKTESAALRPENSDAAELASASGFEQTVAATSPSEGESKDGQDSAEAEKSARGEAPSHENAVPLEVAKAEVAEPLPLVAPANAPTNSRGPSSTASTDQSAAMASAGAPKRSRLPAEMLTHAAAASKARGPVEVHSERLLTRVARALAAAEAREGEVRLRLSPPELGSLRLEIKVQDGAMIAHVEAETETARTAIVENLPALRERLAEQGVRIERFDVDLMQRHAGGTPNQSDQRQSNESPGSLRVALPQRRAVDVTASAPVVGPIVNSTASGLNVIV